MRGISNSDSDHITTLPTSWPSFIPCSPGISWLAYYLSLLSITYLTNPGGISGKEPTSQCRRHKTYGFTQVWSLGWHATRSSILVWRIPWTKKPDGLWSTGSQRIEHNWSNLAHMHAYLYVYYIYRESFFFFSICSMSLVIHMFCSSL